MLRQDEGPALQDQDPAPVRLVDTEEVCGHGRAERTASDDNDVEGARVVLWAAIWAAPILVR